MGNAPNEPYIVIRNGLFARASLCSLLQVGLAVARSRSPRRVLQSRRNAELKKAVDGVLWRAAIQTVVTILFSTMVAFWSFELLRRSISFEAVLSVPDALDAQGTTIWACSQGETDCLHLAQDRHAYETLRAVERPALPVLDRHGATVLMHPPGLT